MSLSRKTLTLAAAAAMGTLSVSYAADGEFQGDKKLSCEALMCLQTADRPGECSPAITRYLSLKFKKPSETKAAREAFLKICPLQERAPTDPQYLVEMQNRLVRTAQDWTAEPSLSGSTNNKQPSKAPSSTSSPAALATGMPYDRGIMKPLDVYTHPDLMSAHARLIQSAAVLWTAPPASSAVADQMNRQRLQEYADIRMDLESMLRQNNPLAASGAVTVPWWEPDPARRY